MKLFRQLGIIATLLFFQGSLNSQNLFWKHILQTRSFGTSVTISKDGNYLLGGIYLNGTLPMIALFNKDGNKLWEKSLCNNCQEYSETFFMKEFAHGLFLIVTTSPYLYVVDPSGAILDSAVYIGASTGYIEQIDEVLYLGNELLISSSYSDSKGMYGAIKTKLDIGILKITSQEIQKQKSGVSKMAIMNDSSLIEYQRNSNNHVLHKLNPNQSIAWERNVTDENFSVTDVLISNDQRILILGNKQVIETNDKYVTSAILTAFNSDGDSLWQKIYSPQPSSEKGRFFNIFHRIIETPEGDFIMVGEKGLIVISPISSINISKVNAKGELIWERLENLYDYPKNGKLAVDFLLDNDQNIVVVGTRGLNDFGGPERAFILKMSNPLISTKNPDSESTIIYPNPCNEELKIENQSNQIIDKIELYNIDGRLISQFKINNTVFNLNTSNLISGIYLCKLYTGQNQIVKKFCKI